MNQDTQFLMHVRFGEPGDVNRALKARGFRPTELLCLSGNEMAVIAWGTQLDAAAWFLEANSALQAYTTILKEKNDDETTPQS